MSTASSLAQVLPATAPRPLYEFEDSPLLLRQQQQESNARSYPRRIPLALKRAQGLYVEDVEGRQFIDCLAEARGLSGNTIGLHQARAEFFALTGDFDQAIQQLDYAKRRAGTNFQLASRIDARQRDMLEQQRMVKDMMR